MSELININDNRATIRWKLLTSVSAAALLVCTYTADQARADDDSNRPLFWLELGGQLDQLNDSTEPYSPAFLNSFVQPALISALNVQSAPLYAIEDEARLSFQPSGSDWVLSASIRYGRAKSERHHTHETPNALITILPFTVAGKYRGGYALYPTGHVKFARGSAAQSEKHTILDFQAGKDVGLGLFGGQATSVLSMGVRFAQFTSKSAAHLSGAPNVPYPSGPKTFGQKYNLYHYPQHIHFNVYTGIANIQRSFHGLGPSVSWSASVPFAGDSAKGELMFDWGANAAILFGRQRVHENLKTTTRAYHLSSPWNHRIGPAPGNAHRGVFFTSGNGMAPDVSITSKSNKLDRSQSVSVPNLGGSIGFSYRIEDFKVSMGYRADFFFGAMDGGIGTRKEENRAFFGPFASISVGLGD